MAGNIIQLAFNGETSATTDELVYKYDYGQKLQFTDLELPEVFEVHFAQQRLGRAVKQIGQNNIVDIPDGLLEKGSVYGWIFLHETESDGETEYEFKIPVKNRATPTDGEITPEQESVISQTIAVLVNAKDAALDAQEAAETAQTAAESAQSGAQTAQGLAEAAQTAAETAQSLAEAAQTASESAQTAAETAQGLAEDAREDAIEAKDLVLGMSATAVTLDPDEPATADYEDGLLTLGIPKGQKGDKGDTGDAGYISFEIDTDTTSQTLGHLLFEHNASTEVDFSITNGHLIMEVL